MFAKLFSTAQGQFLAEKKDGDDAVFEDYCVRIVYDVTPIDAGELGNFPAQITKRFSFGSEEDRDGFFDGIDQGYADAQSDIDES